LSTRRRGDVAGRRTRHLQRGSGLAVMGSTSGLTAATPAVRHCFPTHPHVTAAVPLLLIVQMRRGERTAALLVANLAAAGEAGAPGGRVGWRESIGAVSCRSCLSALAHRTVSAATRKGVVANRVRGRIDGDTHAVIMVHRRRGVTEAGYAAGLLGGRPFA